MYDLSILERMVKDIKAVLTDESIDEAGREGGFSLLDDNGEEDHVGLWDEKQGEVPSGKSYGA